MAKFIIAGERSGVGKTTITLALLAALRQRSLQVQSFKVGPDYIDPMFHQYVTGRPSYNLDPVLTSPSYVQQSFARHSQTADHVVVEGVMGLFDGATGVDDTASTAHIARLLNLPVVLVIDCSHLSRSVAAIVHGYRSFDPRLHLAGVILNRVGSDRHQELLTTALDPLGLPILGILRRQDAITIPDRHLGLIPTAELPQIRQIIDRLADLGQRGFDWEAIEQLREEGGEGGKGEEGRTKNEERRTKNEHPHLPHLPHLPPSPRPRVSHTSLTPHPSPHPSGSRYRVYTPYLPTPPRLAIARDRAFSFYYPDNLEILEQLGVELVEWSPLVDTQLPENIQGLYFGGGFPEVFAEELAANQPLLAQVRAAIQAGIPTYAECGGLMYLSDRLIDLSDRAWSMVGVLPTTVQMCPRLTLGYRRATALHSGPLLMAGDQVWGHEFHRSDVTQLPPTPLYSLQRYDAASPHAQEGWRVHQVHASYLHLHWGGGPEVAARFVAALQGRIPKS